MKTNLLMGNQHELKDTREVEIAAVIRLSDDEYRKFQDGSSLPNRYSDIMQTYTGTEKRRGSSMIFKYNAALVLSVSSPDGIAVCGKNGYITYVGQFPDAREWLDRRIKKMADFVCAFSRVPDAKLPHRLEFESIGKGFGSTITSDNGIGELLEKELGERNEITDVIMHQDCLEINRLLDYGQEALDTPCEWMSFFSLIGCNLEDVHLCHCDEEHDLATIVELNSNTLTEQGKKDWSDMLDAKVERIYTGAYGTQIDLSGCEADRIRDFSYMLAGQCSTKDYDRWVNDEDESADMNMTQ